MMNNESLPENRTRSMDSSMDRKQPNPKNYIGIPLFIFLAEFLVDCFLNLDDSILAATVSIEWVRTMIMVLAGLVLIAVVIWMSLNRSSEPKQDAS